jgi:AAA family ATP:ADP antiporter
VIFRRGEAGTAWLMFAYAFLAMSAYNIVKPVTRSQFISSLGADNLPYVQLAAGLLIGVLVYIYGHGAARVPRRWVVPVTQAGLAVLLLGFWPFIRAGSVPASAALFVFGLALGLLLISQFWTLANDLYDSRQARRLFGFIGGGASLGGAMGAAITRFSVDLVGTANLLPISAVVLLACGAVVAIIVRREPQAATSPAIEAERGVGLGAARRMLAESRHLRIITLLITCAGMSAVIIEQQLNMAAAAEHASIDGITRTLSEIAIYLSLAGFLVQIGLTGRLHGSTGLVVALLILPLTIGASAVVILLNAVLWAPAAARVLDTSLRYTIDKTTREVLFLPIEQDLKHRAKAFVDVTVDRFARAAAAVVLVIAIKPWGLGLGWPQLSYLSLAIVGVWGTLSVVARREYLLAFRRSLGRHEVEPAAVRFDAVDADTLAALVGELASPDEDVAVYALEMLETLGRHELVPAVILQHGSARVRARALGVLEQRASGDPARWLPQARRLLNDPDAAVRAAAVRAVVAQGARGGADLVRQFLDDAESRVSATAAVELADSGNPADVESAELALTQLVVDTRQAAAAGRRDAAAALGRIRNPTFRSLLVPLLHDADMAVAREAIQSARALGPSDALFVPALVSRLGDRILKTAARDTLVSYGAAIVPVLAHFMSDDEEQVWVRRHVPATLARIPTQASMDALMAALDDPDGFLRYKAILAIETLRRGHPGLQFPQAAIEARVVKETSRYYSALSLRYNLVEHDAEAAGSLLVRALEDKLGRTLDRVFRLLGLRYAWTDVAAARYSLDHGDPRVRASALEYLDNLLGGDVRRRVMPILDVAPLAEKVRYANSVLKSRPRDLSDTLAQLVHDEDPVVAGAALQYLATRGVTATLADDCEYLRTHSPHGFLRDAARWLQAAPAARRDDPTALPIVELAARLRAVPLFAYVSVDELFRIALTSQPVRHGRGAVLADANMPAESVVFLLEGAVDPTDGRLAPGTGLARVVAPAALHFADVVQGRPLGCGYVAASPIAGVAVNASAFLTMLADNVAMAQGLFRMLLAGGQAPTGAATDPSAAAAAGSPADPLEVARRFRQSPLFGHATGEQLKDLVVATREVRLSRGDVLWDHRRAPAIYHVLAGEVRLETGDQPGVVAGVGSTVGVAETLCGESVGRRAVVEHDGRALRLDSDELFDVLADHGDLLQGVFRGVIAGGGHP